MFSSPLLPVDRTRLPPRLRAWVGGNLSGPPKGLVRKRWSAGIFQLDRLGDFVLAISAIRVVLEKWGEASCLLVVSEAAAPLAAREFPGVERIVLPTSAPSLMRNLVPIALRHRARFRGHEFDRVVCLSHHRELYKETALSWLRTAQRYQLDHTTFPREASLPWCLELVAHRQLAAAAVGREVELDEIKPRLASVAATAGTTLVVCPFAQESARSLPVPIIVTALEHYRRKSAAPIVISADATATAATAALATALRSRGIGGAIEASNDTFEQFLRRIATAGAVFAVDSAPAHIATALDKPMVLVPGGGRFGLSSPWQSSTRQRIIENRVPCYGCGWRCYQPEPYCLTGLDPAGIAAALPLLA
ncbi:MAG TPA: glycosyltransferase family 9 protein [Opitutaceae bacterium]|nr:glycosyltransferase family 9 protein [Opitutaceae bacterium]